MCASASATVKAKTVNESITGISVGPGRISAIRS
jgi:hypothetical protein